jgi:hypothetical protein
MHGLGEGGREPRHLRLCRGGAGMGLGHVQLAAEPDGKACGGELYRLLLRTDVIPRHVQAPLEAADIDIVARHLSQQCDQHITAIVLGCRQVGAGCFHRPADAPAQIQFPIPSLHALLSARASTTESICRKLAGGAVIL